MQTSIAPSFRVTIVFALVASIVKIVPRTPSAAVGVVIR
jgi:hypothetical protein